MHGHAKERIENYVAPAQSVQPRHFGHAESKRTCCWLKGLPALVPAYQKWEDCRAALGLPADAKPEQRVHKASPGADRWKERSRFFDGIAEAMAEQWAGLLPEDERRMAA